MEEQLYRTFYEIEQRHWWFVGRQRIIEDVLLNTLRLPPGSRVLDVGCGTGAFLTLLSRQYEAYGTDTSPLAIELCRKRGLANAFECTLETFPYPEKRFDLVTLLDVLEHLDDDVEMVKQAGEYLEPGGMMMVTVPAYRFLWSRHDEINHHKRRYTRAQLRRALESGGLTVHRVSYFNTLLFPAALVQRLAERTVGSGTDTTLDLPPSPLNSLLTVIFSLERRLLRRITLPFGLSLLALAQKGA